MSDTARIAVSCDQMPGGQAGTGLSDAAFIELLWRCVSMGGDLMPPDLPHTEALLEWSRLQEAATVERQRREAAHGDAGHLTEAFQMGELPGDVVADIAAAQYGQTPVTCDQRQAPSFMLPLASIGPQRISFQYRNWRGEVARRTVTPRGVEFGATEWHPEPQWLLRALDVEKGEQRLFAMRNMSDMSQEAPPASDVATVDVAVPAIEANPGGLKTGQVWRSPKTWWRLVAVEPGSVIVEGPRGSVRTSRDSGRTWSALATVMTRAGFQAWIRKSGAILAVEAAEVTPPTDTERAAMAICGTGIGYGPVTQASQRCVCTRDGRRPVPDIPRCRECLLAAAAVLNLKNKGNAQ